MEIMQQTGTTVSALKAQQQRKPWIAKTLFIGLSWPRDDLYQRIDIRTRQMYQSGLITETEHLIAIGCNHKHTALQALGYKECYEYVQKKCSLEEAIALTTQGTQRYSKRQMTWFKHQVSAHWFPCVEEDSSEIITKSLQLWENSGNNNNV
jgi:tRNA dimethylallyltransferase